MAKWLAACALVAAVQIHASEPPCANFAAQRQPLFGDLHVHTRYSLDASTQGTLTTPDQAYAFAKGAALDVQPWVDGNAQRSIQLARPLDFAMVSDHSELFGEIDICTNPEAKSHHSWQCRMYRDWPVAAYYWFNFWSSQHAEHVGFCGEDGEICRQAATTPWRAMQRAANTHTESCAFTAFIGYEWTGGFVGDAAGNIHRNVLFASDVVPELPISFMDEPTTQGLFEALDRQCGDVAGCAAIVIPHNSNLSAGLMFQDPHSPEEASTRARYERIVEIMQHKGSSECFYDPLTTDDTLCGFEQLPQRSFTENKPPQAGDGFLRDVLKRGVQEKQKSGINPFAFGFVGSTDTHLGAPGAAEEDQFLGHGGAGVSARSFVPPGLPDHLYYNPGGLAVVWAEQNTRASLFAAMQRRETYATSGPRITARFFAGDLPAAACDSGDPAHLGYETGVPMGGTWRKPTTPSFLVSAQKDPQGMDLEKIQIVKGWVDQHGRMHEAVYDVSTAATASAVDPNTCKVSGRGATALCATWKDPDPIGTEHAFYYARILEGPSCRWSQRQCVAASVDCNRPETITEGYEGCCADEHQKTIRERAWTSPIWVQPPGLTKVGTP